MTGCTVLYCYHTALYRILYCYHTVLYRILYCYHTALYRILYCYHTALYRILYCYHTVLYRILNVSEEGKYSAHVHGYRVQKMHRKQWSDVTVISK